MARKEDDIVAVYDDAYLTVHEPKLKVWKCIWHLAASINLGLLYLHGELTFDIHDEG